MCKILPFLIVLFISTNLQGQSPYSFVFLNKKPDTEKLSKEESEKIMKGHMANIDRLAKEGKLIVAGPFEGGGGMFILKTTSVDTAQRWLSTDPGVKAKRWDIEILPYTVRQGGVCSAKEPYEMVMYEFVRFDAVVSKFTAQTYPEILKRHDDFMKKLAATGNVITEGIFGNPGGGILIMKGQLQQEVIESDPGAQEGLFDITYKKLWVAKGSFCE